MNSFSLSVVALVLNSFGQFERFNGNLSFGQRSLFHNHHCTSNLYFPDRISVFRLNSWHCRSIAIFSGCVLVLLCGQASDNILRLWITILSTLTSFHLFGCYTFCSFLVQKYHKQNFFQINSFVNEFQML